MIINKNKDLCVSSLGQDRMINQIIQIFIKNDYSAIRAIREISQIEQKGIMHAFTTASYFINQPYDQKLQEKEISRKSIADIFFEIPVWF